MDLLFGLKEEIEPPAGLWLWEKVRFSGWKGGGIRLRGPCFWLGPSREASARNAHSGMRGRQAQPILGSFPVEPFGQPSICYLIPGETHTGRGPCEGATESIEVMLGVEGSVDKEEDSRCHLREAVQRFGVCSC